MEVKNFMINKLFMKNKKIWIILTVVALTFLFVGVVSAADYPWGCKCCRLSKH